MKNILVTVMFIALTTFVKAQYTTQIVAGPNISPAVNYVYVGSLTLDPQSGGNCHKIQIDILGAYWESNSIGKTTFYIANRGGLAVDQVVNGSSGFPASALVAYQNGSSTDFYLGVNSSQGYSSFAVGSYLMAGLNATPQMVSITTQTATPSGTPITLNVNPVQVTDGNGNIGIGTSDPRGFKLAVKGNVHAEQVNVDLNNWADYVFSPTYQLPSLSQTKSYIDQNHHLPDMPSEAEVKKNGVDLGEMVKLQIKKIEELTLYLIEKDKEARMQNKVNQNLQTKIDQQQIEIEQLKEQKEIVMNQQNKINELEAKLNIVLENSAKNK